MNSAVLRWFIYEHPDAGVHFAIASSAAEAVDLLVGQDVVEAEASDEAYADVRVATAEEAEILGRPPSKTPHVVGVIGDDTIRALGYYEEGARNNRCEVCGLREFGSLPYSKIDDTCICATCRHRARRQSGHRPDYSELRGLIARLRPSSDDVGDDS